MMVEEMGANRDRGGGWVLIMIVEDITTEFIGTKAKHGRLYYYNTI
jgi:hypothetical protein